MTLPPPAPTYDPSAERDALHSISSMLVGTKMLQQEPGVVYTLATSQARPQDAQAIDQFMQSLDAEKQVNVARAAGTKINLSGQQQSMLQQNGVNFDDVMFTQQDAAKQAQQRVLTASGGKETVKMNADGTLATDSNGNILTQQVAQTKASDGGGGFFHDIGSFFGHVGHDLKNWAYEDTLKPVLHGIQKAYNVVQSSFAAPPVKLTPQGAVIDQTSAQDMKTQGYDPNSIWSQLAFDASGKKHTDLSDLNDTYGDAKVNEALQFLDDPSKYRTSIENDPTSFAQDQNGRTVLTAQATDKLKYLASPDFQHLAMKVNAQQATVGNDTMNALGVDPIKHSTAYAWGSGVTNIAASFLIDPTVQALNLVKFAKLSQVGIDTLGDSDKAAEILTRNSKLPWVNNVQRGWQQAIDLGGQMRTAQAAGDTAKLAALTAKFRAEVPALEPLMENFTGGDRVFAGFRAPTDVELAAGITKAQPAFEASNGIRSMDEAAQFVQSKSALLRLQSGRAGTQASLMPGALSLVGYRKLKGATAAWMTSRSASRATGAFESVLSRAEADPALAKKLIDAGSLVRLMPEADDAVLADGTVLAQKALESDPTLLPSQSRALALTAAGKGDVAANLRNTGDALGDSTLGRFSPTAIAARSRLAAQRLSTLLPRDTKIALDDETAGDRLYKTALTYLNRGDANTLRSLWNFGDGGQRKAIIGGLVDQLGHAAGLGKSASGQAILDGAKTAEQHYSAAGSEIELNGEPMALFAGQTRDEWTLPSFQALQQASAKVGLWESTMGRALTSNQADLMMSQWKMGALFKPSTMTRNWLEGWLRTALEGRVGEAVQARAMLTARNKELWDRGYGADTQKAYEHALATGDNAGAKQIANSSMLSGQLLGRSKLSTHLADVAPLALAGRAYRTMVGKTMDADHVDALLSLGKDELASALEGYRQQRLLGDLGFRRAATDATEVAKAGYGPATIKNAVHAALDKRSKVVAGGPHRAWTSQPLDDTLGADRYTTALAQRVNSMPKTAKAVIDYIEAGPSHDLQTVVDAAEREKGLTAFGSVHFPDPIGNPNAARSAATDAERLDGKRQWAQKLVDEYTYLLHGQNGQYQSVLADYVKEHGVAPDADWLTKHLSGDNRPETALAPEVEAMANGGLKSIPQTLQDMEGGAYQWMVERPLQRTTTSPVFLANYAIARKGLNAEVDKLVESGVSREAAEELAKEISVKNAWVKSEQMIDDPGQKSQFDVIARNMFPFSRATQAMIRRWGTGLWQNPAAARKMMLSYEGAQQTGFIYTNVYGEPTFTYPGSGAMGDVMHAVSKIPGFEGAAQFPVASDMTGGVLMSVPGADNPLRMGMGPMLSIPLREVYKHLLPTAWQGDAEKLDAFINGPVGAGETFSQLVPTAVRKFYQAFDSNGRNSALASSMSGAFANLAAAGLIPSPDASPAELQAFRGRLQTQVSNQLLLRAVLGLVAPAAPSTPTEGTSGSGADYAWSIDGIQQLSDEYRKVLDETGGDVGRANAIFTALHPDEVVYKGLGNPVTKLPSSAYETARSGASANKAYLPSTEASLGWLEKNADFVKNYSSVSAYFLPEPTGKEPFSDAAYQAQLEMGLRIRKTPQEFMNDVYLKHAEATFYPTAAQYDRSINNAKAGGNNDLVSQLTQQKSDWESEFKALNPALAQKQDDYGQARATALGQLADLKLMVKNHQVPDGQSKSLGQMLTTFDDYEAFIRAHPGQDAANRAYRDRALTAVNQWAQQNVPAGQMTSIWNGVFNVLNTNFSALSTPINGGS